MSIKSGSKSPGGVLQRRRAGKGPPEKKIADDEFMAAAIGDVEWLKQSLRGNKGSVNFDKNGLAPIHLASIHGRLECLKLLVEKFKVDVNLASETGWRPVHLCISNGTGKRSFLSLMYLLQHGADPSVANDDGITPMHQAASEGHVQCLKALMEVGGVLDAVDHRGHRPIDLAKLWGHRKCARLLAAEQWHQDKDFLSHEMAQLQKVKMHQVLEEIKADEELKAEQQFYGDIAFKQWLDSRGLPQNNTGPSAHDKENQSAVSSVSGKKTVGEKGKGASPRESLYKANSKQNKASGGDSRRPPPSPIPEEKSTRQSYGMGHESTGLSRPLSSATEKSESEVAKGSGAGDEKKGPLFVNPNNWNKSTQVPKMRSPYVAKLQDYYPRDEYTMKPKFPAKRKDRNQTLISAEQEAGATAVREEDGNKPRMPQLPKDVIDRTLEPEKHERPVVYKCKHISDVHMKKHYDSEDLPRHEAGIHLSNDPRAHLFQLGLLPERIPNTASTRISGISDWNADRGPMDLPNMMKTLQRMNKPTHFPNTKGNEYDINYGQIAMI